jgi:kumamolisin
MTNATGSGAERVELAGSRRAPVAGATDAGPVDPGERIDVTLVLRRRAELTDDDLAGGPLSPEELADRFGADPADVEAVTRWAETNGLDVLEVDPVTRRVRLAGGAGALSDAFGTALRRVTSPHPGTGAPVTHRHRTGTLSLPGELHPAVTAVMGLDDRPQARAQVRFAAGAAASTSYTPVQLATVYEAPAGTDGTGQTVAIIELGGGFGQSDLDTYFSGLGLTTPTVTAVGVDGATNVAGQDPTGADGEVLLDVEVVGAVAPKATILVYFAPNTDAGFVDAIARASKATPAPTAMSISWGQSEDTWAAQSRTSMDQAIADAVALGVTVTVAAGDNGSGDGSTDGTAHVDFPASSPHALACGGTSLQADAATGAVTSETVWNDGSGGGATGGGVSDVWPVPSWQASAGVPARAGGGTGRGVPDVAGDADPRTGYQVYVDGQAQVIGGTSAVAPLWAGFVARFAQSAGTRFGLLQPKLYAGVAAGKVQPGFRDVTAGSNGAYRAGAGWDACTGLGVADGAALLEVLKGS